MRKHRPGEQDASRRGLVLVFAFLGCIAVGSAGAGALLTSKDYGAIPISVSGHARARQLLEEGRFAEARAAFSELLKSDAKNVEAIRGLALCARDEGDDETALQHFQKLTALAPKDLAGWRQQALAAARLGRDMEALAAAQTALSLAPKGDPAMSDLMTRILTSDSQLASPHFPDTGKGKGFDPVSGHGDRQMTGPLDHALTPEPPDPLQGLPVPGKGK